MKYYYCDKLLQIKFSILHGKTKHIIVDHCKKMLLLLVLAKESFHRLTTREHAIKQTDSFYIQLIENCVFLVSCLRLS